MKWLFVHDWLYCKSISWLQLQKKFFTQGQLVLNFLEVRICINSWINFWRLSLHVQKKGDGFDLTAL